MSKVEAEKKDLHGFLDPNDAVAISFWIISISMVAATAFFMLESMRLGRQWATSMNVGSLVTLVAAVHYFYMREFWIIIGDSPILYRYIDWSITVPLQMVEFYFILSAVQSKIGAGMFFRLFLGTVWMLASGYIGEAGKVPGFAGSVVCFISGLCGWGFILFEIFAGEAGKNSAEIGGHIKAGFDIMKFIVSIGWSIYPLGYFFGYLCGAVDPATLNLIYNLADFVNKIAFCLAIWNCAKKDTDEKVARKEVGYERLA